MSRLSRFAGIKFYTSFVKKGFVIVSWLSCFTREILVFVF